MSVKDNYPNLRPSLALNFAQTKTLDPRITFSRASTGTYYDGVTHAKAEENLFTYSQEFGNSKWGSLGVGGVVNVTSNVETAPDGTLTADSLGFDQIFEAIGQSVWVAGVPNTFSIWLKVSSGTRVLSIVQNNGTILGTFTVTDTWQRFVLTATPSISRVAIQDRNSTGFVDVYAWGAQLEQRDTVTAYTATTTQPITNYIPVLQSAAAGEARFDHDPVTGESKGLLIEEQRTNKQNYSEDLSVTTSGAWYYRTRISIQNNAAIAPDGTLTADIVIPSSTLGTHTLLSDTRPINTDNAHTVSFFAKSFGKSKIMLTRSNGTIGFFEAVFDLSSPSADMVDVGNGWYRCFRRIAASTGALANITYRFLDDDGSESYAGDGFTGMAVWGFQVEEGDFPTSYIKTTSAQATRSADSASMTGTNFSEWYRQDEGTLYLDYKTGENTITFRVASVSDGTTSNRMEFAIASGVGAGPYLFVVAGGTTQVSDTGGYTYSANTNYKVASGYKVNDISWSNNGDSTVNDTACIIPLVNTLYIGANSSGSAQPSCAIRKLAYYPARLTNAQLQALTEG